ncbi:conserved hypothetical protein [Frankia canadensis]|uniref:TetR family transcriptional regulator n=1 Tax=Frankia canadensis TaxID=1836972 RepID=A0A2I2KNT6_9ACTN|nr:TetR/AcrR family transcriptional regulator [Frankia canadensis]SNQ47299.1 conserved hypothetical protein [Frankia canadensis]SOU54589.1 conserved hypothetical protein [Frankia canadensis]
MGEYGAGRETRVALLVTAERLFAERGIDGVSLREIALAAGSRNSGAAQYYFGNRAELLRSIMKLRAEILNARRAELLDAAGPAPTTRDALRALVLPLAEQLGDTHYVSFLARLQSDYAHDRRAIHADGEIDATFRQARDLLAASLPGLEPERFRVRFRLMMRMAIAALGEYECHPDPRIPGSDALTAEILDIAAGIMLAPTSPATS